MGTSFQWWIVVGVIFAAVDWATIAQLVVVAFNPFRRPEKRDKMQWFKWDLIAWPIKAAIVAIAVWLVALHGETYKSIGTVLFLSAVFNLVGSYIRWRSAIKAQNACSSSSGDTRLEDLGNLACLVVIIVVLVANLVFGPVMAGRAEEKATRACCSTVEQHDGRLTTYVSPQCIITIEREGTTWFEIHPRFDNGRIYQVRESPAHNKLLASMPSGSCSVDRKHLLVVEWQQGSAETIGTGPISVVATTASASSRANVETVMLTSVGQP